MERNVDEVSARGARSDFCCDMLWEMLDEGKLALTYDDEVRELQIFNIHHQWVQRIDFCPFCGAARPPSLRDEWENALIEAHGEEALLAGHETPEPFNSDKWWKERGL